jgi:hypothetical protein
VFQRAPTGDEVNEAIGLLQTEDLSALCRALLNSNEFLFIP